LSHLHLTKSWRTIKNKKNKKIGVVTICLLFETTISFSFAFFFFIVAQILPV
jgi:hypothetical protein